MAQSNRQSLLSARYGSAVPALTLASPLIDEILSHRSVRGFLPDAVSDGLLETLVAAGQSASSSSNLQVWSVVAVQDPTRKAELAKLAARQAFIEEAPLFLVWLADLSRATAVAKAGGVDITGPEYTEALITAVVDAALAAQNALVAAESLGLGGVYVGAIRNKIEEVAAVLKLPPLVFPVFGMALGWPDPDRPALIKPRLPQTAVLHRETYDAGQQVAAAQDYNATFAVFWQAQGLAHPPWTEQATTRLKDGAALKSRATIREALARLGFLQK